MPVAPVFWPSRTKQPKQQHADQVPQNQNGDGVGEAEAELDAEGAEHPVDRSKVGAGPDPELAGHFVRALGLGNGLKPGFAVFSRHHCRLLLRSREIVVHGGASMSKRDDPDYVAQATTTTYNVS